MGVLIMTPAATKRQRWDARLIALETAMADLRASMATIRDTALTLIDSAETRMARLEAEVAALRDTANAGELDDLWPR